MRLTEPFGLVWLAAVVVLVVLYLYDRRRRPIPVGTLFLWQQVASPTHERQRFRPDRLFPLQLAALLALIAAVAEPVLEGVAPAPAGSRLVLVLDVSASMQAIEEHGTRFEEARRRAAARLAALAGGDEAMVVTAGAEPGIAARWSADHARLRAVLEGLEPRDVAGGLGPALELALGIARAQPGTRVAVFTDEPPEASGVPPDERARLDYVQVGRTDANLAIAGIAVSVPPFHDVAAVTATVDVRNFGRTTHEAVLEARVGGVPWARRVLMVGPRATEHVLLAGPPARGVLEVSIATGDALAVDDRAAAWIAPGAPLDLLVVSDSRELAAAFGEITAALAGSRVEVMTRERYAAAPPAGRRVALFDGVVPDTVPLAVNALYVAPPAGNDVCPSAGRRAHAVVVDWDAEHPALQGLDALQAIGVAGASQLAGSAWGAAIVLAATDHTAFPLLIAGERNGRRTVCLGAELGGPLASSDRVPLLLLTLASLRWLAEPFGPSALVVETGRPRLAGAGPTAPIRGTGLTIAGDPPTVFAERTGVFAVGPPDGARMVLANLFDDAESDIGRSGSGVWPATVVDAPPPRVPDGRPLAPWLLAAALAFLAVEWALWRRAEVARPGVGAAPEGTPR